MIKWARRTVQVLLGTGLVGVAVVIGRSKFNEWEDEFWYEHEPWRTRRAGPPPPGTPGDFGWSNNGPNGLRTLAPTLPHNKPRVVILGTGWGAIACIDRIDPDMYEVRVVSPRNFFLFSPLLPAATAGSVNPDSICTPIRDIISYKKEPVWRRLQYMMQGRLPSEVRYYHAECTDIDFENKVVKCREVKPDYKHVAEDTEPPTHTIMNLPPHEDPPPPDVAPVHERIAEDVKKLREFEMAYDYVVIAVGSKVNTFGTKGVEDNCLFMKEINDAMAVRNRVFEHFEKAALPTTTEAERHRLLQFVVVGGGPTGVEVAAELQDLFSEDLMSQKKVMYKNAILAGTSVTLVQSADRLLDTYEEKISKTTISTAEKAGTKVLLNHRVTEVTPHSIKMKNKITGEAHEMEQGLVIWTTGVGPRRLIKKLASRIDEQTNHRALMTDAWLRVIGKDKRVLPGVFALGDCATIEQSNLLEEMKDLFSPGKGPLSLVGLKRLVEEHRSYLLTRYPHSRSLINSLKENFDKYDRDGNGFLDADEVKEMLTAADRGKRSLPATAQAAQQEGEYLADLLNTHPQASLVAAVAAGKAPFVFKNKGQMAYVGNKVAVMSLGDKNKVIMGDDNITNVMWHAAYWWMLMGVRTKCAVSLDWTKTVLFGRNSARW